MSYEDNKPRITIDQFLDLLRGVAAKFRWFVSFNVVRGISKNIAYCPIGAVCEEPRASLAAFVGQRIGLSFNDTITIMKAADNSPDHSAVLRTKILLAIAGPHEPAANPWKVSDK